MEPWCVCDTAVLHHWPPAECLAADRPSENVNQDATSGEGGIARSPQPPSS
jgi:hypothetical protein